MLPPNGIDDFSRIEGIRSLIQPTPSIATPVLSFGEIGIAAVAGALAASRPNRAGRCPTMQTPQRYWRRVENDAGSELFSYELSNT
ncbi:hypothetical protein [Bosea sp. PAMC 26642]|uniref:hypothetical protein n=1 Tax=Bosea sp. (strain PAMC 26642) TaxID=1792307 RepID=UPI000A6DC615|nr:hypothetical protein [Bosea sp. PAMC 26642]